MRVLAILLATTLLTGAVAAPASAAEQTTARINVGLVASGDTAAVLGLLGDRALTTRSIAGLTAIIVEVPATAAEAAVAALAADTAHVRYAELDGIVEADADKYESTNNRPYTYTRVLGARTWGLGDPSITVAVVDSGVTPSVELPAARLTPGYDFVDDDADPADDDEHGTMVAGVIAGEVDNEVGASGVCARCRIMPVRVLAHREGGPAQGATSDAAAGIVWAAAQGAQVINVSMSTAQPSRLLEEAVRQASGKGSLVVAAAGNDGVQARHYPAAIEPVLAVGTVREGHTTSTNRNARGDLWIDVAAEDGMYAMDLESDNRKLLGTSGPAALVSGIAALGFAARAGNTAKAVRSAILAGAVRPRYDTYSSVWDPSIVDASYTISRLGAVDDVAPVISDTGLVDGQVLSWDGVPINPTASDDHAIQRIEEIVDGKVIATVDRPWHDLYVKVPIGTTGRVLVTIRAYDYAGNHADAFTTVQADAGKPVASFVPPVPGTYFRTGRPAQVVVRVAADSPPVTRILGAAGKFVQVTGTDDWTGTVTPTASGFVTVNVVGANRISVSRSTYLPMDDQGPQVAAFSPKSGAFVPGTFTSALSGVIDLQRVTKAELWVDGRLTGTDTAAPFAITVRGLKTSQPRLRWQLTDAGGNVTTLSWTVRVDTDGPTATVDPAQSKRIRGTFTSAVTGVKDASGVAKAELWANGKYLGAGFSKKVATGKLNGNVKLVWKLTDKLGNARTYTRTVIADNKGPSVSITKAPKNKAKVKGTVKVYVKASDSAGVARVELLVNGKVVAKDVKAGYVLSVNTKKQKKTMKVRVRAYDKLGNVTYTSTRTWRR
ncbi:hypothetical protein ACTI_22050 [Actinoplanes sp. OR16]|uniref:S8 family serine peptidase n=1 Tax=Actinoplanes sp. OR16 TaxID=946334 RepID=UPI000F6F9F1B|nr:S8 family serine peptidase [Actinoplanes sp. OR16]BBH65520.1 hypothetical protein ACTI_22050 [Actinoplanes sp. OR16]